jgi:hypothetical protein
VEQLRRRRPLEGRYPYLFVDAKIKSEYRRVPGSVWSGGSGDRLSSTEPVIVAGSTSMVSSAQSGGGE